MHNAAVAITIAGLLIVAGGCNALVTGVHLDSNNVESVTLCAREAVHVEFGDKQRIQRLSTLLGQGKCVDDHKCVGIGKLSVKIRSGSVMEFEVLLGHGGTDMELRQQSRWHLLSVSRSEFLAIFDLPAPEEKDPRGPWPAKTGGASTATSQAIRTSP